MSVEDFKYLLNFTDIHRLEDLIEWASEAKKTKTLFNKYEDYFFACSVANPKTWQQTSRELKRKLSIQEITMRGLLTERREVEQNKNFEEEVMQWKI